MTAEELKQVGDAMEASIAMLREGTVSSVIARINARCVLRRMEEERFDAVAFTAPIESRQASTLGLLGDSAVRQRLVAAGIVS